MGALLTFKLELLSFQDKDKAAAFKTAMLKLRTSTLLREHLIELAEVLSSVRIANKMAQSNGVTVHLFSTVADKLLMQLDADADVLDPEDPADALRLGRAPKVQQIAKDIAREFRSRYVNTYPPEVGIAQFFVPEGAFDKAMEADGDWEKTARPWAIAKLQSMVEDAYNAAPLPEIALPMRIALMKEGTVAERAAKKTAADSYRASKRAESIALLKESVKKEFIAMTEQIDEEIFSRRTSHTAEVEKFDAWQTEHAEFVLKLDKWTRGTRASQMKTRSLPTRRLSSRRWCSTLATTSTSTCSAGGERTKASTALSLRG